MAKNMNQQGIIREVSVIINSQGCRVLRVLLEDGRTIANKWDEKYKKKYLAISNGTTFDDRIKDALTRLGKNVTWTLWGGYCSDAWFDEFV